LADFYIGQGDTASTLLVTLRDANNNPVDITGASVHIDVTPIHGGAKIVDAAATIVNAPLGQVSYTFTAPQTATPGDYLATFTVTFAGGQIEAFPNAGYYLVTINPDAPTTAQEYISVEELKKELNLTGTTYTDQSIRRAIAAASESINNLCRRKFTLGSPGESRTYGPSPSADWIQIDDVVSVSSVVMGTTTLTLSTDYYLDPVRIARPGPPYDVLRSPNTITNFGFGTFGQAHSWGRVTVTGQYGWPSVPPSITEATVILSSRYLQRSRSAPFAILTFGDGGEAARLTRSDPDFFTLIGPYMRYEYE
jgi:hypothetical protein